MFRIGLLALVLGAVLALGLPSTDAIFADEKKDPAGKAGAEAKKEKIPPLASGEEADEALKVFKTAFKAKGYKGDEKTQEQDWAMRELAKVQHPKIVDALAKVTKNRNADLRTGAVLQLGQQRRIPGYAGQAILEALKRHSKDQTFVMSALESVGQLRFMGAREVIAGLMKHHDYAMVKNVLVTIGRMEDHRFIEDIIKLMKELKLEKGASWDGVSANYDTGTSGDHDQKMAEKIGKAKEAKNKGKGKRAAKSMRDLGPIVLEVMYKLTGQQFTGGIEARKWLKENRGKVDGQVKTISDAAKGQVAEAKAMKKLR